ncbi:hypothetical protein SNK04_014025 [Fusarium graminearum]
MVTAYTSATAVTVDVLTPFPSLTIPAGEWVITGSPFTTLTPSWSGGTGNEQPAVGAVITLTLAQGGADDVGKWVDLNAGLVQITAVTSPTVATGELRKTMSAVVAVPALAWVLMGDAWVAPTDIRGLAPSTNRGCGRAGHVSSRSPCGVHASVNT